MVSEPVTSPLDQKDGEMVQGEEAAWAKEGTWNGACSWVGNEPGGTGW